MQEHYDLWKLYVKPFYHEPLYPTASLSVKGILKLRLTSRRCFIEFAHEVAIYNFVVHLNGFARLVG